MYPGGFFQYNKDPNKQIYVIKRYDRETGKNKVVIGGAGGAVRPQVSHDGKKLAFVRRVRTKSVLYIFDLETGLTTPVYDGLSKDQQEAWAIFGVYTNFNWTPDDKSIIIWAKGKMRKVDLSTGAAVEIPFKATADHAIVDALKFFQDPDPDSFMSKVMKDAKVSPDGKMLVFNAVGHVWMKKLPDGKPKRLTDEDVLEYEPVFSPDGKSIVYVTWDDEKKGAIKRVSVKGGITTQLTKEKAIYRMPSYSRDGSKIAYYKESGNGAMGFAYTQQPGIYYMNSDGSNPQFVINDGQSPEFSQDGSRIYYQKGGFIFGSLDKSLRSVTLTGQDQRIHVHSKYGGQFSLSPDNKWLAFAELSHVYVMPFSENGQTLEVSKDQKSFPMAKVTEDGGLNLQWWKSGDKLSWTLGSDHVTIELNNAFTFLEGSPDSIGSIPKTVVNADLELQTDRPEGLIALVGATLITMNGEEVIENGTIVVDGNRLLFVGASSDIEMSDDMKKIDVSGKYIIPGIIDTHAHLRAFRYGLSPQKEWPYYANLAYGITATHDPSSNTQMSLSQSEMVKAGEMVGPRVYTTGTILYGADGDFKAVVNSLDDARFAVKRTKAYGAFSVKSYNQPRREQRQQVIQASKFMSCIFFNFL